MPEEERAAYYEKLRRTFDRVDGLNADLADRAERRRVDGADLDERHDQRMRQAEESARMERERAAEAAAQPKPAPAQQVMDPAMATALNIWVDRKITAALEKFAAAAGEADGELAKEERALIRGEITAAIAGLRAEIKVEIAAEARIAELERRLADAERRAA